MLKDELHRTVHLGDYRFNAVVVGAGQSGAVGQILHGQGTVQARGRLPFREPREFPAVETLLSWRTRSSSTAR